METVITTIKEHKTVFSQTKEQPIECDIVLPDYYPEISRIIDCTVTLGREAVTVTSDKIGISGKARIRLLYSSAENEIRSFDTVTKYSRMISGESFSESDICIVSQNLSSMNFRAVSPRKAEVRATASVKAEVVRTQEKQVLSDALGDGVEKLLLRKNYFDVSAFSFSELEITDKLSLPVPKEKVVSIIRENVSLDINEIKSINNKIMLNGYSDITFVYIDVDNVVSREMNVKIPFTVIKDVYGVKENDRCRVLVRSAYVEIDFKNPSGGENEAQFSVMADIVIISGSDNEIVIIDDLYSVVSELDIKRESVFLPGGTAENNNYAEFSGEIQCFDPDITEICDKCVSNIAFSSHTSNGKVNVSGSMTVSFLAKNAGGDYCSCSKSCSFEKELESLSPGDELIISVREGALNADMAGEGKIAFSGEVMLRALLLTGNDVFAATAAVETERKKTEGEEKIVLYYADKGEKIWDIAKGNNTSVNSMKMMNDITEDELSQSRLLVFRN